MTKSSGETVGFSRSRRLVANLQLRSRMTELPSTAPCAAGTACRGCLLNFTRDGAPFVNFLFVMPIRIDDGRVAFIGSQLNVVCGSLLKRARSRQDQLKVTYAELAGALADKHSIASLEAMTRSLATSWRRVSGYRRSTKRLRWRPYPMIGTDPARPPHPFSILHILSYRAQP